MDEGSNWEEKEIDPMATFKKLGTIFLSSLLLGTITFAAPTLSFAKKYKRYPAPISYRYIYYPAAQVYYSPVRRGYYYPYAGGWRYGMTVPVGMQLGNGVSISLGGPTPYFYHPTVIQQYPVVVLH